MYRGALNRIHTCIGGKRQGAGAQIQRLRTVSASKTCRTMDGHRDGKFQASKWAGFEKPSEWS